MKMISTFPHFIFFFLFLFCVCASMEVTAQAPIAISTRSSSTSQKTFSVTGLSDRCTCNNGSTTAQYSFYWEFGDGTYAITKGSAGTSVSRKYVANSPTAGYQVRVEITPIKVDDSRIKYATTTVNISGLSSANPTTSNPSVATPYVNRDAVASTQDDPKYVTVIFKLSNNNASFLASSPVPSCSNNFNTVTLSGTLNSFDGIAQAYYYNLAGVRTIFYGNSLPTIGFVTEYDRSPINSMAISGTTTTFSSIAHGNFFVRLRVKNSIPFTTNSLNISGNFTANSGTSTTCQLNANSVNLRALKGYDPNQKTVFPEFINPSLSPTTVRYKVECENIGEGPVYRIYIVDDISEKTDPSTISLQKIVVSSNTYIIPLNTSIPTVEPSAMSTIMGTNALGGAVDINAKFWREDNKLHVVLVGDGISLLSAAGPDTQPCEESVKAYIVYTVQTSEQLVCEDDMFGTSAQIIFDSNPPIETNPAMVIVDCDNAFCPSTAVITTPSSSAPVLYETQEEITNNTSTTILPADSKIYASAGSYILITPTNSSSFSTSTIPGSVLSLYIDGCTKNIPVSGKQNMQQAQLSGISTLSVQPNPFSYSTTIHYSLPQATVHSLLVFDLTGKQVATLVNNVVQDEGNYQVDFIPNGLPSGLYICQLRTPQQTMTQKIMYLNK